MFPFFVVVVVVRCILICVPQNYLNIPEEVDYVTISGVQEEELSIPHYTRLLGGSEGPNKLLLKAVLCCMTGQFEPRPSVFSEAVLGCPVDLADFVLTKPGQGLSGRPGGILAPRRILTVFPPGESSVESEGVKESQAEPPVVVAKEPLKEEVVEEVKEVVKEAVKEVVKEVVARRPKKKTKNEPKRVSRASQRAALNKKVLELKSKKEAAAKEAAAKEVEMKALEQENNEKDSVDEESVEEVEMILEEGEVWKSGRQETILREGEV